MTLNYCAMNAKNLYLPTAALLLSLTFPLASQAGPPSEGKALDQVLESLSQLEAGKDTSARLEDWLKEEQGRLEESITETDSDIA
ncbi:MAG: hypothetical protein KC931_17740, partial [Candidatus Omnitrophica bacterium]|nr:hypothetical protein [Candidatus Omnitrophota bacterium]